MTSRIDTCDLHFHKIEELELTVESQVPAGQVIIDGSYQLYIHVYHFWRSSAFITPKSSINSDRH